MIILTVMFKSTILQIVFCFSHLFCFLFSLFLPSFGLSAFFGFKPIILIFDEATSALDNVTQKSISESIGKLECTRIVIAHRLSTIQNAKAIMVMDHGRIIERGEHDYLISQKGEYYQLYTQH